MTIPPTIQHIFCDNTVKWLVAAPPDESTNKSLGTITPRKRSKRSTGLGPSDGATMFQPG